MVKEFYAKDIYYENGIEKEFIKMKKKSRVFGNFVTGMRKNTLYRNHSMLEKEEKNITKITGRY